MEHFINQINIITCKDRKLLRKYLSNKHIFEHEANIFKSDEYSEKFNFDLVSQLTPDNNRIPFIMDFGSQVHEDNLNKFVSSLNDFDMPILLHINNSQILIAIIMAVNSEKLGNKFRVGISVVPDEKGKIVTIKQSLLTLKEIYCQCSTLPNLL